MYKLLSGICLLVILSAGISFTGCSTTTTSINNAPRAVIIQRGDLTITVSSDGNLVMPQAFDLKFGAPGNVEDVFVEEGDFVTEGKILATLDNYAQQLDIKSANCSLQQTLSDMYENIPGIQTTYNYPSFYPNSSATLASAWAADEVAGAYDYYSSGKFDESISMLSLAVSDLQSCALIFQDAIDNHNLGYDLKSFEGMDELYLTTYVYRWGRSLPLQWQDMIEKINSCHVNLDNLSKSIKDNSALCSFQQISTEVQSIDLLVKDNVNRIRIQPDDLTNPAKDLSLSLYRSADEQLDRALLLIEEGKAGSLEYYNCIDAARHNMELCNSILGNSYMVLEHGLGLNEYQQINVNLAKQVVSMDTRSNSLLKTIVVAPFDGTVVSVGVKKNDILSAMDYSSKTAVQMVDTKDIRFEGKIDEIDVLRVQVGQQAAITIDAVPDKVFTGTVTFISPYGTADTNNVVKFDITIKLDPSEVELKGGLTATADISVYKAENVVLVPLSAVTTTAEGSSVNVVTGPEGKTGKRQVTLGKQNFQYAEVLSGLEAGDTITIEEKLFTLPVNTTMPAGPPPPQ